ncbi:hypothetical protein F511_34195 [Dorcoceras hygrometricum]|uniref:Uncharacterized protein n=1 Tax=Dorcoceras hygrometricum TaxID=472368 RepID=A0A2Z7A9L0_9LAMI|nr:hypothetical protein F511_34195 [Dorcoceras hygrometricum]
MRSARTDSPRQVGRNNFRRGKAAAAALGGGGGFEREEGGGHLELGKSHSPKSSSYAQHIELSIRAGISSELTRSARMDSPRRIGRKQFSGEEGGGAHGGGGGLREDRRGGACFRVSTCVTLNGSGIQLAVGPQPLRLRNHNSGLAHRIMVKRLATSPHDPLGITDSACKNQLVVVSVQYSPFNPYIPIRSTTIDSIGYPRMSASGESSTTMHRLLHASGSHPIPPPDDPK